MDAPSSSSLSAAPIPEGLLDHVLCAIDQARAHRLRQRLVGVVSVGVGGLCLAALSWSSLHAEITNVSWMSFLRLAASDPDIVFANMEVFLSGVLEELPLGIAFFFFLGLIVLLSGYGLVEAWRKERRSLLVTIR